MEDKLHKYTYIILWEFYVKEEHQTKFEEAYGPNGEWVQLFKQADGYLGTALLRDENKPLRYVTIDRWISSTAYEDFKQKWAGEYQKIDLKYEGITEFEDLMGTFEAKE